MVRVRFHVSFLQLPFRFSFARLEPLLLYLASTVVLSFCVPCVFFHFSHGSFGKSYIL